MAKGNITASGTFGPYAVPNDPHRDNPLSLMASGSFGGGTLKVQISPDGNIANASDLTGVSLTAAGNKQLPLGNGVYFVILSGATSPNINWWLQ